MKQLLFALLLATPAFIYSQEYSYKTLEFKLEDPSQLSSYTYKNLRLIPIKARAEFKEQTKSISRYMPLKEALQKKKIIISEKDGRGEGAEVNTLFAQNSSNDTIYLMAGEVIQGGKQDRVIGQDVILPPNSKKVSVSVFCVEHGRWSSAGANKNQFNQYFAVSGLAVRKAVDVDKNQSKVWEKVADGNAKNKVNSKTGAYTDLHSSNDYQKSEKEYYDFLFPRLNAEKDIIGVIVISGQKVIGCEILATESMFKNSISNLLRSYIHEAVTNGQPVKIETAVVKKYMDDILADQRNQDKKINAKGKVFTSNGKKLHITTYE